ncbi:MAG: DUF2961 domain-containing protein [Actinobacteria bacterium]|nr:MAG: DUF2961 domain-containing protein [Actinomycetota bacterium]
MWTDPSRLDPTLDSRAVTFENPTGARGAGGASYGGRKGAPSRLIAPGERVTLADLDGPGTIRHLWCTVPPAPPEALRALVLEVFYDDHTAPSVAVPLLDFFGAPLGRPVAYASMLTVVAEGRGFNAYFPMPFRERVRVELTNHSPRAVMLYFQIDFTLEPEFGDDASYLHVSFRRENPTAMKRDFVITEGLRGPGRFLGCAVGVRPIDGGTWYGEGEVKIFRDGDTELPTICGTGLEDYVGSAWGMGPHAGPYAGAPLDVRPPDADPHAIPAFVAFYRWHLPDPIVFTDDVRVTIQQIGAAMFAAGQEAEAEAYFAGNPAAGQGVHRDVFPGIAVFGIAERVDDYSAAAFLYARDVQEVPPVDPVAACGDLERRPFELPSVKEPFLSAER